MSSIDSKRIYGISEAKIHRHIKMTPWYACGITRHLLSVTSYLITKQYIASAGGLLYHAEIINLESAAACCGVKLKARGGGGSGGEPYQNVQ